MFHLSQCFNVTQTTPMKLNKQELIFPCRAPTGQKTVAMTKKSVIFSVHLRKNRA